MFDNDDFDLFPSPLDPDADDEDYDLYDIEEEIDLDEDLDF